MIALFFIAMAVFVVVVLVPLGIIASVQGHYADKQRRAEQYAYQLGYHRALNDHGIDADMPAAEWVDL